MFFAQFNQVTPQPPMNRKQMVAYRVTTTMMSKKRLWTQTMSSQCSQLFEIDPNINIDSLAFKDMVSTDPIARESAQPSAHPRAADTSNKKSDWNW
jgi:hypothetical protein